MIDKKYLPILKRLIRKKLHLNVDQYKDRYFERRLNARMNLAHTNSIDEYIRLLKNDSEELKRLEDALTINVTEFFRNNETFDYLEKSIIPQIINNKLTDSSNIIKVWSAGCSSGEETYTLAILFLEELRKSQKDVKLAITGTDIDRHSLITAKSGLYQSNKVNNIKKELFDRYFEPSGEDYEIKPFVREHIRFSFLDLMAIDEKKSRIYDLILCRNVIIYFKEDMKKKLLMTFYKMLRKNSYFIQGKNESLIGDAKEHFVIVDLPERVYKRDK